MNSFNNNIKSQTMSLLLLSLFVPVNSPSEYFPMVIANCNAMWHITTNQIAISTSNNFKTQMDTYFLRHTLNLFNWTTLYHLYPRNAVCPWTSWPKQQTAFLLVANTYYILIHILLPAWNIFNWSYVSCRPDTPSVCTWTCWPIQTISFSCLSIHH